MIWAERRKEKEKKLNTNNKLNKKRPIVVIEHVLTWVTVNEQWTVFRERKSAIYATPKAGTGTEPDTRKGIYIGASSVFDKIS